MGSTPRPADKLLLWLIATPLLALLILPLGGLVARSSVADLWEALCSSTVQQALGLSVLTAAITVLLSVLCGSAAALLIVRGGFPTRAFQLLIDLPTVLPPAVAGLALLTIFGRQGWFGAPLALAGYRIPFTTTAVVLAQLFVAAPYYTRACVTALRAIDPLLRDAAAIDGASPWQYARFVALPLMRHGLLAGVAQTTARALSEFGATALFAGSMPGRTRTMALAIYVNAESNPTSAVAMSIVLLLVAMGLLLLTQPTPDTAE